MIWTVIIAGSGPGAPASPDVIDLLIRVGIVGTFVVFAVALVLIKRGATKRR